MSETETETIKKPLNHIERALEARERIDRERRITRHLREQEIITSIRRSR